MPDPALAAREVLRWAGDRLSRAGVDEPRREALRLARDVPPEGRASEAAYRSAVARRADGEPHAYAAGVAGFRYLDLGVDRRVLIPRPETEGLVDLVLEAAPGGVAVDVGTGSGCIALSLAREGRYARVVATDISVDALRVADANRRRSGLAIELVAGDLTEPLGSEAVDVLVANPPYLTFQEYEALDRSVRAWEPSIALVSGADGLAATANLVARGGRVLRAGGVLALEVDCRRAGRVAGLAEEAGFAGVEVRPDAFGRDRYVIARKRG